MDLKHKSISLADQIFEQLENDILSGKYKKGEVLTELKLCEELGVSRTPIREALHRLSAEHIIEDTQRGSVVLGISKEDLDDIFKIRLQLESIAAAECAKNITDDELKELLETVELQEFYIERQKPDNIKELDSRFHERIYKYTKSNIFYDVLLPLHHKTQKYRHIVVADQINAKTSAKEHRMIYNAIASRDEKAAAEIVRKHILNAQNRILGKEEL